MPRENQASSERCLHLAAAQFELSPAENAEADSRTRESIVEVVGPLKTTVMLLEEGGLRLCLVTTHFGWTTPVNVCDLFRQTIADELQLPRSHVLLFSSHNHCCVSFAGNAVQAYGSFGEDAPAAELLPIGEEFLSEVVRCAKRIESQLEPVTTWWAEGSEGRITYNRKGVRADGTSYLMREEDRVRLGTDFRGDIDTQAPIVVFRNSAGKTVAALAQFTGHPVTSYHPERPIVFGEWPQVACDMIAEYLRGDVDVPVGFLQGCAGDVNSKEMLSGNVQRSIEFGRLLGQSYVDALPKLQLSERAGMDLVVEQVSLPLTPLPPRNLLEAELTEMDDFITRAENGDENTLACVGQNYARALSPKFRAELAKMLRCWNNWAIELHRSGKADSVAKQLEMELVVLRLGDVGIVGLPCEPFQEIGRQIRRASSLPLSIPCGYTNVSHGYIPDSGNVGGQEYMSSHYRYTKHRPPIATPAGDVLADTAAKILNRLAQEKPIDC